MTLYPEKNNRFRIATVSVIVFIITAAVMLTANLRAQTGSSGYTVQLGTYDIMAVFEQHPANAEISELAGSIQQAIGQAQANNDAQQIQQLQQQFEQRRMQAIQRFHDDIINVLPEIARSTGVKAVAEEFNYTDDDVDTKDITAELIKSVSAAN